MSAQLDRIRAAFQVEAHNERPNIIFATADVAWLIEGVEILAAVVAAGDGAWADHTGDPEAWDDMCAVLDRARKLIADTDAEPDPVHEHCDWPRCACWCKQGSGTLQHPADGHRIYWGPNTPLGAGDGYPPGTDK